MKTEHDLITNSLTYKYFGKNLLKNKKYRDILISFEEILNIKKNIKKIFNTDDTVKIKELIGTSVNGKIITKKDFEYVQLINNTYDTLYAKCKKLLGEKIEN